MCDVCVIFVMCVLKCVRLSVMRVLRGMIVLCGCPVCVCDDVCTCVCVCVCDVCVCYVCDGCDKRAM